LQGEYLSKASPAQPRGSPGPRPKPGPSLDQPGPAQAWPEPDFWKFGNLEPENLGIWDPTKSPE